MRRQNPIVALALTLQWAWIASGCADHRVPEPLEVPSTAHISWLITTHRQEGGEEETVCQSDPRAECVVRAEGEKGGKLATVHLYLHPAPVDTRYQGTMRLEFLIGARGEAGDMRIDATVERGRPPARITVTRRIDSTPGVYSMAISLVAISTTTNDQQEIRDVIPVTVK